MRPRCVALIGAGCLAALAACLAGLAACGGPRGRPAAGEAMLVVSNRGGAWRVYEILTDDGAARLVGSPNAGDRSYSDTMPARLPDERVVFVSDRDGNPEIYIASPADPGGSPGGGAAVRLTRDPPGTAPPTDDAEPAPLGSDRIVFSRAGAPGDPAGAARELYIIGTDGSGLRRLTHDPADDHAPAALPGAKGLAFVSDRLGAPRLCVMRDIDRPDDVVCLADQSAGRPRGAGPSADGSPQALADGAIVFSRRSPGGAPQLFVARMETAGLRLRQITDSLTLPFGADEPVVAPDGSFLLTTGPVPPEQDMPGPMRYYVYRIDPGGYDLARISREPSPYDDFTRRLPLTKSD